MTALTPPAAGQPAAQPQPRGAPATGVGGAVLLIGARIALWLGVQVLLAGLLVLSRWPEVLHVTSPAMMS